MGKGVVLLPLLLLVAIVAAAVSNSSTSYKPESVRVIVLLKDGEELTVSRPAAVNMVNANSKSISGSKVGNTVAIGDSNLNNIEVKHEFSSFNGFSAVVDEETLEELRNSPAVATVEVDQPVRAFLDSSAALINATNSWLLVFNGTNLTGFGQSVCVIDTGVNYSHPALGGCSAADFLAGSCNKVVSGYDFVNNDDNPVDDNGHGTHVAGIIASTHESYRGVAPNATVVAVKVLDSGGSGSTSDVVAGIDWCVNNASRFNISVISMSLGTVNIYGAYCDSSQPALSSVIANATGRNISVVVATGNDASSTNISAPACIENATAVGSTTKADGISSFSNYNNITDFFAPGSSITSLWLSGASTKSGTSMAAPHVSAAFALLLQYKRAELNKTLTPAELESTFKATGKNLTSFNITRINIYNATIHLDSFSPIIIIVNNTPGNATITTSTSAFINITSSETLSAALLEWNGTNYSMAWDSNSWYRNMTNLSGTYTYMVYGNDSANNWGYSLLYQFTSANIPPVVALNAPLNASYLNLNFTLLNWSFADENGDNATCFVYASNNTNAFILINTTYNATISVKYIYNYSGLNNSYYAWFVSCNDSINVSNSTTYLFVVDTLPPATNATLNSVNDSDSDGNLEVNWTDDNSEGNATYMLFRYTSIINSTTIGSATNIKNFSNNTRTFTDNTTVHGNNYYYALVTVDNASNFNLSVVSNPLNFTANDTVAPKIPTNLTLSGSGATAAMGWLSVLYDVNNSPDFTGLKYQLWRSTTITNISNISFVNETFSFVKNITANSTTDSITSSSIYHYALTAVDDAGNYNRTFNKDANYANVSLTYSEPVSSSGSSSGGGGGGGGGTAIISESSVVSSSGGVADFSYKKSADLAVSAVVVSVSSDVTNAKVTVKEAVLVGSKPEGIVYKYLSLTTENLPEKNITGVKIKFQVARNWTSANNIDPSTVALNRFKNNEWNKLLTRSSGYDGAYYYYESESPGFSIFAITGRKLENKTTVATTTTNFSTVSNFTLANLTNITTNATNITPIYVKEKEGRVHLMLSFLLKLLAVLAIVVLVYSRKVRRFRKL